MHSAYIMEIYIIYLRSRNVISRLCNKNRDQGSKGIWGLGIDRMVTYSTLDIYVLRHLSVSSVHISGVNNF